MKLSEERLERLIGWSIIIGITGNLLLCLNLYRQVNHLESKVNQLSNDTAVAVQELSRYVWEIRNTDNQQSKNKPGEFE